MDIRFSIAKMSISITIIVITLDIKFFYYCIIHKMSKRYIMCFTSLFIAVNTSDAALQCSKENFNELESTKPETNFSIPTTHAIEDYRKIENIERLEHILVQHLLDNNLVPYSDQLTKNNVDTFVGFNIIIEGFTDNLKKIYDLHEQTSDDYIFSELCFVHYLNTGTRNTAGIENIDVLKRDFNITFSQISEHLSLGFNNHNADLDLVARKEEYPDYEVCLNKLKSYFCGLKANYGTTVLMNEINPDSTPNTLISLVLDCLELLNMLSVFSFFCITSEIEGCEKLESCIRFLFNTMNFPNKMSKIENKIKIHNFYHNEQKCSRTFLIMSKTKQ